MRTRLHRSALLAGALLLLPASAIARGGHGGGGGRGGSGAHGVSGGGAHVGVAGHGGVIVGGGVVGGGSFVAPGTFGGGGGDALPLPREASGSPGFGPFGGLFGGSLYVGPDSVWSGEAHWGKGFWASDESGWAWYPGTFWVSPAYPGWVWMGPPWVWDGEEMITHEGYWTTAALTQGEPPPAFADATTE